jgi:VWFA-related protein
VTKTRLSFTAIFLATTIAGNHVAGQSGTATPERQSYTSTATAILVDVVVRDKREQPVTDLSAADFEVMEDGVRQRVDTFTRVLHGGGIGVGIAWKRERDPIEVRLGPLSSPTPSGDVTPDATTALVFDHLSAESLRLAQKATLDYIPMTGDTTIQVAVLATEPRVRFLQSYTTDRARVRKAVQRLLPAATAVAEQRSERVDELVARRRELASQGQSSGAMAPGGAGIARNAENLSERDSELQMIRTELDMLRADRHLDRAQSGQTSAEALLAIVQSLAPFPGRKTIVFFSEGLPVSPALAAKLDWVIDAANRANITAYAVDANGLRAKSTMTASRKELDVFGEERFTQLATGSDRTDRPLTMAMEQVEDTLRSDARSGLARLAEETGGFLVEGSNDLTSAFRRIDEDNRFHYLLSYSPHNPSFDGKYHTIQVKVHRPGVQVFARKGYRALNAAPSSDSGAYEVSALALLERTPLPNAFPVQAGAFSFPEPARPGLTPVLAHVGTDVFRFIVDPDRSTYTAQAAIVVRIRDREGQEVQKLSQQYLLSGDARDLDAATHGDIIFYREADLAPGVYTIETIVFDAVGHRGSARIATLTVPRAEQTGLRMSSLVLVNRVEEVDEMRAGAAARGPLYVGRFLLYPNLGEPITKATARELPFYFTIYGDAASVKVYAELLRDGNRLAEIAVPLPPSTAMRVQHVGRLPIVSLPSGMYELRIRAVAGAQEVMREAFFRLE